MDHKTPREEKEKSFSDTATASQAAHQRKHDVPMKSPPPPLQTPPDPAATANDAAAAAAAQKQPERRHAHSTHKHRQPHADKSTSFTAYPLGIALFAAWLITVFAAFSFDVVLDVFQGYLTLRDPPVMPWLLLVGSSAGLHLSLMGIVVLLGRLTKRRFRVFQPFVGGDVFVILQLVGYVGIGVTAIVRAVLLSQRQERYGAYAVLGAFAVAGHAILLYSLSFFQSPRSSALPAGGLANSTSPSKRSAANTAASAASLRYTWRERLATSPMREIAWLVLCCAFVILSSTVAEYHPAYRFMNVVVIISFVAVSLLTIQYVIVPEWLADYHYHVFLPVVLQSPTMYVLQVFGNGLLLVTLYAELVLFNAQQNAPPSWHLGCGLMAVMAVGAHLLLVHQLHAWVVEEEEEEAARQSEKAAAALSFSTREPSEPDSASASRRKDRAPSVVLGGSSGTAPAPSEPQSTTSASKSSRSTTRADYKSEIGSYGPVLPTLLSVVLCAVLIGILYVLSTSGDRLSGYVRQGLTQTEALLVTLLFVQPIVTHPMGVFLYGKAYRLWQPFEGNPDFILLQCVGWLCYGLAIFFATLHLNEHGHVNFLLLLMAFLVLSQFFIHMSVVRFGRNGKPRTVSFEADSALAPSATAAGAAAATATSDNSADPLTDDRASSHSPARDDATSDDGSSQQRTPYVERQRDDSLDASPSLASAAASARTDLRLPPVTSSVFGGATEPSFGSIGGPSPFTSGAFSRDPLGSSTSLLAAVLNGELLLALVLIGVSLVLRVVVIAAAYVQHFGAAVNATSTTTTTSLLASRAAAARTSAVQLPVTAVIAAATFFSVAATPVVQWSMRHHVRLLHPQSHAYVALATLGWGTYLLLFSRFLVLWGLLGMERVSTTSPITRVGLSCFLPSADISTRLRKACDAATVDAQGRYQRSGDELSLTAAFEGAVEGFVWCFPFLCLLAGNLLQTHAFLREAATQEKVRRALHSALQLFHDRGVDASPSASTSADSPSHHGRNTEAHLTRLLRTIAGSHASLLPSTATDSAAAAAGAAGSGGAAATSESSTFAVENSSIAADPADVKAFHDAARYMTVTLCAATSAAYLSAAFLADAQPLMTLGFGAVGTVSLGLSCFALHYIYGTRVHNGTRPVDDSEFSPRVPVYTFFMPFAGGTPFVVLQSIGWISFTCVGSLMVACLLEGRGTPTIFVLMAALSIVAQVALLRSVGCFDEAQVFQQGFLQRNAEGFLAAICVAATVSFCRLYDMAEQGRATAHVVSSMVPIVVCSVAVFLAIPLGLVSLQRQAELYGLGSVAAWFADDDDDGNGNGATEVDDDAENGRSELEASTTDETGGSGGGGSRQHSRAPSGWMGGTNGGGLDSAAASPVSSPAALPQSIYSRANTENPFSPLLGTPGMMKRRTWSSSAKRNSARRRGLAAVVLYLFSTVLAMLVLVVLPFALVFMGYAYYTQRATVTYGLAVRAVEALLCCFTVLVVLPMLVVPVLGRSSVLRNVHSAFCCWALYNIPTYTFLGGISTPFIYNCRGTYLFTINMCSMALLSNLPYMPIAMSIFSMCSFAYFLRYHFYDGVYLHKHDVEPVPCVVDLTIAIFWLWYQRRYHGRPEITGRLQSRRATQFFQRNFFRGLCYYFSMRVIVGDGYVLPMEEPYVADRSQLPRVDLNKPENQYMFSFLPHGVFPGTSIVVPKTEIWEKAVGRCKEHFVSTHCADIVFNVPLMREFPMCLGAMSVSRRGIESSLKQGNSPLIVTGGQSEMLLTQMSDYEMHVVCHHTGFVRMAIKNRVPLVPVISFSESNILDNVHCIRVQRWFLKRIAFPFPVMPLGRWYLPLPTTKPVTMVVGQPLSPLPGHDNPDDPAHVEELRLRYFEHLEVLFYKYRAEAGYPEMELYLHNGIYNPGVRGTPSVATPLTKSGTGSAGAEATISVEMFDSAVRRAFAMTPDENRKPAAAPAPDAEKKKE